MDNIIRKMLDNLKKGLSKKDVQYFIFGRPATLSNEVLTAGAIMIEPKTDSGQTVTTGLMDQDTFEIHIILAKAMRTEVYQKGNAETGAEFMTRVMAGCDDSGQLNHNSIKYIIRNTCKQYGSRQPTWSIDYQEQKVNTDNDDAVCATLSVTQEAIITQPI